MFNKELCGTTASRTGTQRPSSQNGGGGGGGGRMMRGLLSAHPIFLLSPLPTQSLTCSVGHQGSEGHGLKKKKCCFSKLPNLRIHFVVCLPGLLNKEGARVLLGSGLLYRKCQWLPAKALFRQSLDPAAGHELQRGVLIER